MIAMAGGKGGTGPRKIIGVRMGTIGRYVVLSSKRNGRLDSYCMPCRKKYNKRKKHPLGNDNLLQ